MSNKEPLWKTMSRAYDESQHPEWEDRHGYAAELRAVADEIETHPMADRCIEWGDVADWLRSEADRAEAGR